MKIDIDQLKDWIKRGIVQPGAGWGDAKETACLMSALTGRTSTEGCAAEGWPLWLAELGTVIFDNAGDNWIERSIAFANAVKAAEDRGADFDAIYCQIRLTSILPIALRAIGDGDEPWRVECRNVVQHAISVGGRPLTSDEAARASRAVEAAMVMIAARAVEAAEAARAAGAKEAARAVGATWVAWAAAHTEIYEATIAALAQPDA